MLVIIAFGKEIISLVVGYDQTAAVE